MRLNSKWLLPVILSIFCSFASVSWAEPGDNPPAAAAAVAPVNINTASAEELAASLVGVGPSKAAAIVEWREANGGFKHLEELQEVKGIGAAILEKNRDRIAL
ncbi:ComEA family DNA-binding protein [Halioxenophilus sp. WMMB6]|uniref:ComEA family DNA-binding protein n=1 Tax=Halioxenophilus sp. WMMB6 TaxID=3073815 RepID=UPI00295E9066|nr:ComEA family DNA-binding protein [Halioxenophilus sp. WMMB6]